MTRLNDAAISQRQIPDSTRLLLYRGSTDNALPQDELNARLADDGPHAILEVVRKRLSGQKTLAGVYQRNLQLRIEQLDFRRYFRSDRACHRISLV
jgi:hypothetical protein